MALTVEGVLRFSRSVMKLDSFPLFVLYLLMICLARFWHKYTKPLNLRPVLVVYNMLCSAMSLYILVGFVYGLTQAEFVYQRAAVSALTPFFYWYHISKKLELLDTVFMVLRHKSSQISFLHVYHHSSMLILSDYAHNITPWPALVPVLGLNSFVHVCLYFYYGLTALYPSSRPSWKQRLTELQIIQFYIDMGYSVYGYLYHNFCVYGFIYGILMIYLFSSFYYQAYIVKKKKPVTKSNGHSEVNGKKFE